VTVIHLNDTHTMSGEQEVDAPPSQPSAVFFGQMPRAFRDVANVGFKGCVSYFQLNGEELHVYADAAEGRDIVECSSAACVVEPCRNGAMCARRQGGAGREWFCKCPPGYAGEFCERPVCQTNPCRNGGTCLSSVTGPGFLCLCPLGTAGVLCTDSKDMRATVATNPYSQSFRDQRHTAVVHALRRWLLLLLGPEDARRLGGQGLRRAVPLYHGRP